MRRSAFQNWHLTDLFLPLLTLALLVFFTLGIFLWAPYSGFYFNPTNGQVSAVFVSPSDPNRPTLQVDDMIQQIGTLTWGEYHKNGDKAFFEGVQPGNSVEIIVNRADKPVTIQWVLPGFNIVEFRERLFNIWWIPYIFWLCGTFTQLFMRPKDMRWRFFVLSNYLTAIWLIVGDLSLWRILASSLILHALSWLVVPFYWGFHWAFPKPLGRIPRPIALLLFVGSAALAVAEMFQVLPRQAYALGVLLAFGGSIVLLFVHLIWQRDRRREVQRLGLVLAIILLPFLVLVGALAYFGSFASMALLVFLPLPLMPAAYFYSIYRDRLGNFELRANRAISICVFLILLLIVAVVVIAPFLPAQMVSQVVLIVALINTVCAALIAILFFPHFQAWLERHVLGIRLPHENLLEVYAARIATSPSASSLEQLLHEEVLPSLLVRQFAFIQFHGGEARSFLRVGIDEQYLPHEAQIHQLVAIASTYRPPDESQPADWVRLVLPLRVGGELLGCWLLGRRDPDDIYLRAEITALQALADQTAIALSNILQTARVRKMYQSDIERSERQRLQLSHELHDDVLNEMAVLLIGPHSKDLPEDFAKSYAKLTQRVREIASDLRPPMLSYGLKSALVELTDNLMERTQDTISIQTVIDAGEERYPDTVEKNLFRIVQQGLENALRHGGPSNIQLSGRMNAASITLLLEDDGVGFVCAPKPNIDHLLDGKHFGLANMFERAEMIGAHIEIYSAPGQGTHIVFLWKAADTPTFADVF